MTEGKCSALCSKQGVISGTACVHESACECVYVKGRALVTVCGGHMGSFIKARLAC